MDIYSLSRNFFDWSFENPERITPSHTALYFFAIEHCNRLGWKEKFGFPSQMAMEAIGIKSYNTYSKVFGELVEWGFFNIIQKSINQYSANIIALSKNNKATNKALDKALTKHKGKQRESTSESNDSIDIQVYNSTNLQNTSIQVSKDTEQAPKYEIEELEDIDNTEIKSLVTEPIETFGKDEINLMQGFLRQAVGLDKFKDSKERWYVTHCYNLMKKIGKEEFQIRLKEILSDPFKAKNCNKLAYLYGELKSYIHTPVIEPKQKVSALDITL